MLFGFQMLRLRAVDAPAEVIVGLGKIRIFTVRAESGNSDKPSAGLMLHGFHPGAVLAKS